MPDSDDSASARRKRATARPRPAGTTDDDAHDTEPTEADEAVAARERRAELERLRHKLHRKFH